MNWTVLVSDCKRCAAGPRFSPLQPFDVDGQLPRKVAGSRRPKADSQFSRQQSSKPLVEPPTADPNGGWREGWRLDTSGYRCMVAGMKGGEDGTRKEQSLTRGIRV